MSLERRRNRPRGRPRSEPLHEPESTATPVERVAAQVGNHATGQLLGRAIGDGLLANGAVHPDVQATIASRRGGGAPLDDRTRAGFESHLGDSLGDVRVHTGEAADTLARSVAARAFTTGSDIFFAAGEYRPGSSDGDRLLAHEVAHTVQQQGAPLSGPMTVTEPGDAFERHADAVADELTG